jgi:hypothetical protein
MLGATLGTDGLMELVCWRTAPRPVGGVLRAASTGYVTNNQMASGSGRSQTVGRSRAMPRSGSRGSAQLQCCLPAVPAHQNRLSKCIQLTLRVSLRFATSPTTDFGSKDAMAAWPANPTIPANLLLERAATRIIRCVDIAWERRAGCCSPWQRTTRGSSTCAEPRRALSQTALQASGSGSGQRHQRQPPATPAAQRQLHTAPAAHSASCTQRQLHTAPAAHSATATAPQRQRDKGSSTAASAPVRAANGASGTCASGKCRLHHSASATAPAA